MSDYNQKAQNFLADQNVEEVKDPRELYNFLSSLVENIQNPNDLLTIIQKLLFAYAKACQEPLVRLLYKHNVDQKEIGEALGKTDAAVSLQFLKNKTE